MLQSRCIGFYMGIIHKLPSHISDQIAAGEVVERPASVVRELIENAIDAKAASISIHVMDGGKRLIRVTDNGCGMDRNDLELVAERHATSKIRDENDLAAISTLGFRGEAMPSIASVSRFKVTSSIKGADTGWRLKLDFGMEKQVEPAGCPAGTIVEVEDLFLRIPARLRFLKRRQTEMGHIAQQVRLYAVACPHIRFVLKSDGREVFSTSGDAAMPEALWPLLGHDLVEDLIQVDGSGSDIRVTGFVAPPDQGRSSSRAFYFFLNGRSIHNRLLWKALAESSKGIFMSRTYAVGALFLHVDPGAVDVNVHPAKQEVRFHHADAVYRVIYHGLKRAWENRGQPVTAWEPVPDRQDRQSMETAETQPLPWQTSDTADVDDTGDVSGPESAGAGEMQPADPVSADSSGLADSPAMLPGTSAHEGSNHGFVVIGQLADSYILAQGPDGLLMVDQHAAHEGLIFQRISSRFETHGTVASQPLLFPEIIEVRPDDAESIPDIIPVLDKLGMVVEQFGPSQIVVKAVPDFLSDDKKASRVIRSIIDRLLDSSARQASTLMHDIFASMACHCAIRANHPLEPCEMQALLDQLREEDVRNCPHGRPVAHLIDFNQIKRNFRRS